MDVIACVWHNSCEALVTDALALWVWVNSDPLLSRSHSRMDASAPPDTMLLSLANVVQKAQTNAYYRPSYWSMASTFTPALCAYTSFSESSSGTFPACWDCRLKNRMPGAGSRWWTRRVVWAAWKVEGVMDPRALFRRYEFIH